MNSLAFDRLLIPLEPRPRKVSAMHMVSGHMVSARQLAAPASGQGAAELGDLPEWNLADLYSGMEAPELKRDIARAASEAIAFEGRWKGTLAAEAERGAAGRLGEALRTYEALEELIGRIVS